MLNDTKYHELIGEMSWIVKTALNGLIHRETTFYNAAGVHSGRR